MKNATARGQQALIEAQVEELDWSTGEMLRAIREMGLERRTMVIFTSDNGPAGGSSGPLRGKKGSHFEGGHREPTIAWWPGRIPAGSVCDEITTAMDLLPTFAKLAGTAAPAERAIDGKDIWPLLAGTPGAKTPHDRFFYQRGGNLAAVRHGDWKLLTSGELFNLRDDIGESKNVAKQHPDKAALLKGMLDEFSAEIARNKRPVGVAENPRTLVPRPGVEGEEGYRPALSIRKRK